MAATRLPIPGILQARTLEFITSLVAQMVKNLPVIQETHVRSLGQEDTLEKGTAAHSSILPWRISCTQESSELQSMGLQRVRHNWETNTWHSLWQDCMCKCLVNDSTWSGNKSTCPPHRFFFLYLYKCHVLGSVTVRNIMCHLIFYYEVTKIT